MKVLVTGVTGYIGSHLAKILHEQGHEVHGLDLVINGHNDVTKYCTKITQNDIIKHYKIEDYDCVVHLAGVIEVEESVSDPAKYYQNNLVGTMRMLQFYGADTHFIFASTAGAFDPVSPYARSKVACEDVIKQLAKNYTIFRFFNVAGSDGENMQVGKATHLIRIAAEVAAGKSDKMFVYGNDYETVDGTCVRDYVHVVDLARAISSVVDSGPRNTEYECIGSGKGYSVLEVLRTMSKFGSIDVNLAPRRPGDAATLVVENKFPQLELKYSLEDMCRSAYEAELRRDI